MPDLHLRTPHCPVVPPGGRLRRGCQLGVVVDDLNLVCGQKVWELNFPKHLDVRVSEPRARHSYVPQSNLGGDSTHRKQPTRLPPSPAPHTRAHTFLSAIAASPRSSRRKHAASATASPWPCHNQVPPLVATRAHPKHAPNPSSPPMGPRHPHSAIGRDRSRESRGT